MGNLTRDKVGHTFSYDAESRQTRYDNGAASYVYDGAGQRVAQVVGLRTTVYVYDAAGQVVAEYGTAQVQGGAGTRSCPEVSHIIRSA